MGFFDCGSLADLGGAHVLAQSSTVRHCGLDWLANLCRLLDDRSPHRENGAHHSSNQVHSTHRTFDATRVAVASGTPFVVDIRVASPSSTSHPIPITMVGMDHVTFQTLTAHLDEQLQLCTSLTNKHQSLRKGITLCRVANTNVLTLKQVNCCTSNPVACGLVFQIRLHQTGNWMMKRPKPSKYGYSC